MFYQSTLFLLLAGLVLGQTVPLPTTPLIYADSVLNAGTMAHQSMPVGGIGRGSLFWIFGRNLGPADAESADGFPLNKTLGGVGINVAQGRVTVQAYPLYVQEDSILAVMPSNAPLGTVTVQVVFGRLTSNQARARIAAAAPGLFSLNGSGEGLALAQNAINDTVWADNHPNRSARPGQRVSLLLTGLGPLSNGKDAESPDAGPVSDEIAVNVGGQPADVEYAGRIGGNAGLDQVIIRLADRTPNGCYVPVQVIANGSALSNMATISVSPRGGPCSDADNPLSDLFRRGGTIAAGLLLRIDMLNQFAPGGTAKAAGLDRVLGMVRRIPGSPTNFNRLWSQPPAGSCTAYTGRGNPLSDTGSPGPEGADQDAGVMTVRGAAGSFAIPLVKAPLDYYGSVLSRQGWAPTYPEARQILVPGAFSISWAGIVEGIAAITSSVNATNAMTWNQRSQLAVVPLRRELQLKWENPGGNLTVIQGSVFDRAQYSHAMFVCVAPAGEASFTVPQEVLRMLPASPAGSVSTLLLGSLSPGSPSATRSNGINLRLIDASISGRTVSFVDNAGSPAANEVKP